MSNAEASSEEVGPGELRGRARGVRPGSSMVVALVWALWLVCGWSLAPAASVPAAAIPGAERATAMVAAESASELEVAADPGEQDQRSPVLRAVDLCTLDEDAITEAEERESEFSSTPDDVCRGTEQSGARVVGSIRHSRIRTGRCRSAHGPRAPPRG